MSDRPAGELSGLVPTVQATLLCERVITEEGSRKKTVVGVFNQVYLPPQGGMKFSGVNFYARMFDAAGRYSFRVDYVQVEGEQLLVSGESGPVEAQDPLTPLDLVLRLPPLAIPAPGRYEFRLYANNVYVAHVGMIAVRRSGGER